MTTTDNKRLLQDFVQEFLDSKNLQAADKLLAANFFHHDLAPGEQTGQQTGREGFKTFIRSVFSAFSGFRTSFEDMVAEADLVAGRWTQSVRHTGPYLGLPASGRQARIGGISIVRIRNGTIIEEWEANDDASLLQQLNVIPPLRPLEQDARGGTPGFATGTPQPVIPKGVTTLDDNKSLANRFFFSAWNAGNAGIGKEIFAPGFVNHNLMTGQQAGVDGINQFIRRWHTAFPDASVSVDMQLAEGNKVVTRWTSRGTHRGTFLGFQATGKPVAITGIDIHAIDGGRISESWGFWTKASLLQQIGAFRQP
jgi:steroid delta-isomerase-like uncharacterized protein